MLWGSKILKLYASIEHTFDRSNTGAHRCRERGVSSPLQLLASGDYSLQNNRVDQRFVNTFAGRMYLVFAFYFYCSLGYGECGSGEKAMGRGERGREGVGREGERAWGE